MEQRLKKWEWVGFAVVSVLAVVFHFIYEWSGSLRAVGLISAVNESVWEHVKMIYFPYLFFAVAEYFILRPDLKRFFCAKTQGLLFVVCAVIIFTYTYSGVLGFMVKVIDISFTFLWIWLAFWVSFRSCTSEKQPRLWLWIMIFAALLAAMLLFTAFPPKIALFLDTAGGFYGFK